VVAHDGASIQLGPTPLYLDPRCHEALYEIDVGVNEVREQLNGGNGTRKGNSSQGLSVNSIGQSRQEDLMHE
jgi:hypothetical protein